MLNRLRKNGFTLPELMVGIFILSVGIVSVSGLVSSLALYSRFLNMKLTAAYLTQEGLEIVRNIRDTNWIEKTDWDDGIFPATCGDDCSIQAFIDRSNGNLTLKNHQPNRDLLLDRSTGFYSYDISGPNVIQTPFHREIRIRRLTSWLGSPIEVCVTTRWIHVAAPYTTKACDRFYDWYEPL
jgi:prepilin-type N-terminal cleavage/methylation domain-containing protein